MIGLSLMLKYYAPSEMPAFSVPAAEHSTITSWGKENEAKAYRNMLEKYPNGIVSIVSDSYDIFNACGNIFGKELKAEVSGRNGTVVIRPDSGDIIPTVLKCLEILESRFGSTTNDKGYKVLPSFVRLLQGDGMNIHTIRSLCRAITDAGWSLDNIACFGMGGKLLQGVDRDTLKFAFKCAAICIDDKWYPVSKNPVGDTSKTSKAGIHTVSYRNGNEKKFYTISNLDTSPFEYQIFGDRLVPVFLDGTVTTKYSLDTIRENVSCEDYGKRVIGAGWLRDDGKNLTN
jgi:nicotinamide phosphoribosyltransferase